MRKSPFPGMDPYLEMYWSDLHPALIGYIRDALAPQLSEDLAARQEQQIYVREEPTDDDVNDSDPQRYRADVSVHELPATSGAVAVASKPELSFEKWIKLNRIAPFRQRSVRIIEHRSERLITVIELLSPANKVPGRGREKYLRRRSKLLRSGVSLVEIDLTREGESGFLLDGYRKTQVPASTYRVLVTRGFDGAATYLPVQLFDTLPSVPVPLRQHEAPAVVALQPLLDRAYAMGRYGSIDYRGLCAPTLNDAERSAFEPLLRERESAQTSTPAPRS